LAQLYLAAIGDRDPVRRVQGLTRLVSGKPDDIESHVALARENLEARLWGEARRHLTAAAGSNPSIRGCPLMADLEGQEFGDGAKVRQWLSRATDAPADNSWRCGACHATHERWQPICDSCGAFGTLGWRAPASTAQALPPEEAPALAAAARPAVASLPV